MGSGSMTGRVVGKKGKWSSQTNESRTGTGSTVVDLVHLFLSDSAEFECKEKKKHLGI